MFEFFGEGFVNRIAVYVPSTVNVSQRAADTTIQQWVTNAHLLLATQFGGATSQLALGSYVANNGELVTEEVTIVYAYAHTLTSEHLSAVKTFVNELKAALGQELIAVEVNDILYFV